MVVLAAFVQKENIENMVNEGNTHSQHGNQGFKLIPTDGVSFIMSNEVISAICKALHCIKL